MYKEKAKAGYIFPLIAEWLFTTYCHTVSLNLYAATFPMCKAQCTVDASCTLKFMRLEIFALVTMKASCLVEWDAEKPCTCVPNFRGTCCLYHHHHHHHHHHLQCCWWWWWWWCCQALLHHYHCGCRRQHGITSQKMVIFKQHWFVRFDVLIVVLLQVRRLWDLTVCCLVSSSKHFSGSAFIPIALDYLPNNTL